MRRSGRRGTPNSYRGILPCFFLGLDSVSHYGSANAVHERRAPPAHNSGLSANDKDADYSDLCANTRDPLWSRDGKENRFYPVEQGSVEGRAGRKAGSARGFAGPWRCCGRACTTRGRRDGIRLACRPPELPIRVVSWLQETDSATRTRGSVLNY